VTSHGRQAASKPTSMTAVRRATVFVNLAVDFGTLLAQQVSSG
jgi:hypothetical protein